ncbi:MAG: hypothetical protein ABFD97_19595 [Syntrophobacter sp.]
MREKRPILVFCLCLICFLAVPFQTMAASTTVSVSGGGTYSYPATVTLNGSILDLEGGSFDYSWLQAASGTPLEVCKGTVTVTKEVLYDLLPCSVEGLQIGEYSFTLSVTATKGGPTVISEPVLVTIQDTVAPTLAPVAVPSILWPPNNKLVKVVVTPNASDNSGAPPTVTATVVSSEPVKLVGKARKTAWNVPKYNDDGTITFMLPAQRLGKFKGRVYTITVTAADASGNTSTADVLVRVPHDKRKVR